mmetsp:Transcript_12433/g.43147  ORF Transcript_12433/g.43147 Transcript_12433/m.43147 type:complete len:362 (-) Transcript_12433:608-1693(-)
MASDTLYRFDPASEASLPTALGSMPGSCLSCLGVMRLSTNTFTVWSSSACHTPDDTEWKTGSKARHCVSASCSATAFRSRAELSSLDSRTASTRLKSSRSRSSSGFTSLSSAPCALRKVSIFSYWPHNCSAASFLLEENLDTLPGTDFPPHVSTSSMKARPLLLTKSLGNASKGPFEVEALSHLTRKAGGNCSCGNSAGGSESPLGARHAGALSESADTDISPAFTPRKGTRVSSELSDVPLTGSTKRLPWSSMNSMSPVNDSGLPAVKLTCTGSSSLAMPIMRPSGKESSSGRRALSAGSLYLSSRLSNPWFTTLNVATDVTPSGTAGITTSRVLNASLGSMPSPRISTRTYSTSDCPSR